MLSFVSIANSQITKTIYATYNKAGTWGEWSGLIFTTDDGKEMRFLKTNNDDVVMRRFWQDAQVTADPMDVSGELHTGKFAVGKRYLINYTTKKVEYKGMDEDGAQTVYENVIVTFEVQGGSNINGTTCKVFQNGELVAVAFGATVHKVDGDGKIYAEKAVQNKNEVCKNGTCIKIVFDKDLTIHKIVLPDLSTKSLKGKVSGKEVLQWQKNYQGQGNYRSTGIRYEGDLQQAAIAIIAFDWFR